MVAKSASRTTLKPPETITLVGIYRGIVLPGNHQKPQRWYLQGNRPGPGFLSRCEMDFVHPQYLSFMLGDEGSGVAWPTIRIQQHSSSRMPHNGWVTARDFGSRNLGALTCFRHSDFPLVTTKKPKETPEGPKLHCSWHVCLVFQFFGSVHFYWGSAKNKVCCNHTKSRDERERQITKASQGNPGTIQLTSPAHGL